MSTFRLKMNFLQIISFVSIPLSISSVIGIVLLQKRNTLFFLSILTILVGCVVWRVAIHIETASDRYGFVLILPAIILCGYAGQEICIWIKERNYPQKISFLVLSCFILGNTGVCICKALRLHLFQDFYIKIGEEISKDSMRSTSPILLDISHGNALRFFFYSNCKSIQEKTIQTFSNDEINYFKIKASNYAQTHDAVYITSIMTQKQEESFSLKDGLIPMIKIQTNSRKNKYAFLYKVREQINNLPDDCIIWSVNMDDSVDYPKVVSTNNKYISIPSGKFIKGWTINLPDCSSEPSGIIELQQIDNDTNVLHLSSKDLITIYKNDFLTTDGISELDISYQCVSPCDIYVKLYFYNSKKQWFKSTIIDFFRANVINKKAIYKCHINSNSYSEADYVRLALSLQKGDIYFYDIKMYSTYPIPFSAK